MGSLPDIPVKEDCNYIAAFLTMACPYRCSYCINEYGSRRNGTHHLTADQWIAGLSRLTNLKRDEGVVPVTLQGGEPSVHPGFYEIINGLPDRIRIDILTNLAFDEKEMIRRVDPERLWRDAPYASIRVSYHPTEVDFDELLNKTRRLQDVGFSIGIFGVLHPDQEDHILECQRIATEKGLDFRTKEFLGRHDGRLYGTYHYPQACSNEPGQPVMCRTTELLIDPQGGIHRCHHYLYDGFEPVGSILDPDFTMTGEFRPCDEFGRCNPCDIKLKTNRLQQFGYCAVEILRPEETHPDEQPAGKRTVRGGSGSL